MDLLDASILFAIMVSLALLPSTSVALVVSRTLTMGAGNGAAVAMGIVTGDLIFVSLAILGLTALAELMGSLFLIIKYAAGAYLIWFGIQLLRNTVRIAPAQAQGVRRDIAGSFIAGLLITLGDIKAIFFYASLFPAFVHMNSLRATDIVLIIMITIIAVGGVKLAYVLGANKVARVSRGLAIQRPVRWTAGGLMFGTGAYLICKS